MVKHLNLGIVVAALALAGCAGGPPVREQEPHHYSRDVRGDRLACYATDVVNEYECYPVAPGYPRYAYDPFYDPWWPRLSIGFHYGWPVYYHGPHWHHRHHGRWRHR